MVGLVASACSAPAQPSASGSPAGAAGGSSSTQSLTASIFAPRPLQPASGAQIPNASQPVTLVVQNAVVTKSGPITYTFEVAADSAFSTVLQTKDGVAEGNVQTSVRLDSLTAAKDYWWHARATGGGTTGVYGPASRFTIGPAIAINAPVPIAPLTGAETGPRPVLRVKNAVRTGPAGPLTYTFEVASSATFNPIVMTGTNTEGVNETGFIPPTDLPTNGTLFWRATAADVANRVASPPSAIQSIACLSAAGLLAAQEGALLWTGVQPPGITGHATLGNYWNVEYVTSYNDVVFLNPPLDTLQVFDLLDRGFDPQGAIDWMRSHGYPTSAAYYQVAGGVIGFTYEYMSLINGRWDLILRIGA